MLSSLLHNATSPVDGSAFPAAAVWTRALSMVLHATQRRLGAFATTLEHDVALLATQRPPRLSRNERMAVELRVWLKRVLRRTEQNLLHRLAAGDPTRESGWRHPKAGWLWTHSARMAAERVRVSVIDRAAVDSLAL